MNILAIGAHPDDIEIGAGGTIARHIEQGDNVTFIIATKGGASGNIEVREREGLEAARILGVRDVYFLEYHDTMVPLSNQLILDIEKVVHVVKPDRAYIPFTEEIHQDHRALAFASLAALRNTNQILMYEGPSSFPNFDVNFWINIDATLEKKKDSIAAHVSQGHKEILKLEAIVSMNRYRGFQCRHTYAEGFKIFRMYE
jgi:LmbE family N-acetylglucosaminyl deacetylase